MKINDKVTVYVYGDEYPATIVDIRKNGREIDVQKDCATDVSLEEQSIAFMKSEDIVENYIIERDEKGVITTYTLRRDGKYKAKGDPLKVNKYLIFGKYRRFDTIYNR